MATKHTSTKISKYRSLSFYRLCRAYFGDPGINGFGKIENATQVSKTVFSHLNRLGIDFKMVLLLILTTIDSGNRLE